MNELLPVIDAIKYFFELVLGSAALFAVTCIFIGLPMYNIAGRSSRDMFNDIATTLKVIRWLCCALWAILCFLARLFRRKRTPRESPVADQHPPLPKRAAPTASPTPAPGAPSPSMEEILVGLCATLFWGALGAMFFCILRDTPWWGMAVALGGAELCCVSLLVMMWRQRTRSSASPRSARPSPAFPPLREVFAGQCYLLFAASLAAMLLCMYRSLPWGVALAMQGVAFSATCLIIYLRRRKRASSPSSPYRAGDLRDAVPHDKRDA